MNTARDASECQRLGRWLTAYLDAELDAVHILEVEEHLEECEVCVEYLATLRATRTSLKQAISMRAPLELRERIGQSLAADRDETALAGGVVEMPSPDQQERPPEVESGEAVQAAPARSRHPQQEPIGLRYVLPLAAAATVALVLGVVQLQQQETSTAQRSPKATNSASIYAGSLDSLIDDLVAQHVHPPPPETTDPDGLERFDPYVGVRVRRPKFDQLDVRYVGARMHRRAALLQYVLRDRHRVTFYVFDTKKVSMKANRLKLRQVGEQQIYVGNVKGFSVAASERDGIGWAVASDLNDEESTKLLVSAAR